MASADYYADETQWGNYQYITMEDLVSDYMMSTDDDDYTANVPRYKILYQARRAFKELYYDVVREIRAIELELSSTLAVTLPPDFINYVRISYVTENGELMPLAVDNRQSIAQVYLQDNDFEILFDDEGCVLQSTEEGLDLDPVTGEAILPELSNDRLSKINPTCYRFDPNVDHSRVYPNGSYQIDKTAGVIRFSSDVFGKDIVLEYISDGLFTGCEGRPEADLRIHKFAEEAVLDYIYYKLIERRRNVPANEKGRARRKYFNSRRMAKRRLNTVRTAELIQHFKKQNMWIKG
jgi:hypothetical protein